MAREARVSLENIAGVTPYISTYTDVLRQLGSNYSIERLKPHQTKTRLLPAKLILHFSDTKIVTVFIAPGGELSPDDKVTVVGVEDGSLLRTADGLHVGMCMSEAELVIECNYQVTDRFSSYVEVVSLNGHGPNVLGVFEKKGLVDFIGLYRQKVT